MNRTLMILSVSLSSIFILGATVPKDKRTILIDLIRGQKGRVKLTHEKHTKKYKNKGGVAINCKDCHHMLKRKQPAKNEKVKGCSECHTKVGQPTKKIEGKEAPNFAVAKKPGKMKQKTVIFHKYCREGCHKALKAEGKKISSCKTCHKKA